MTKGVKKMSEWSDYRLGDPYLAQAVKTGVTLQTPVRYPTKPYLALRLSRALATSLAIAFPWAFL